MKLKNLIKKFFLVTLLPCYFVTFVWALGDSFTITLTPTGERGVIIETTTVAFGYLAPGASSTTAAIPVVSTGTIGDIEYTIGAAITGDTPAALASSTDTLNSSELCLHAQFNSTSPAFRSIDVVDQAPIGVDVGDDNGYFEGDENMDDMGFGVKRNLWCKVTMPADISYSGEQTITVTITAEAGD